MSRLTLKVAMISISLLSSISIVALMPGCGQDRPGVRVTESEMPEGFYDPLAKENLATRLNTLMDMVKGEDVFRANMALKALGGLGADAEPKLEELKKLQDHPDENLRPVIKETIDLIEADIARKQ